MSCLHPAVHVKSISRILLPVKLISNLIVSHTNVFGEVLDTEMGETESPGCPPANLTRPGFAPTVSDDVSQKPSRPSHASVERRVTNPPVQKVNYASGFPFGDA
jgi:hypothetical protein